MIEIKPPMPFEEIKGFKIFLAGTIDMGNSEDWQQSLASAFRHTNFIILNPRRTDWDSSWKQEKDNPVFKEQVLWELNGLEKADLVIFYFAPNSASPITLMELGLIAGKNPFKLLVCCPEGFYRKGNVDIVCDKYNIPQISSIDELKKSINTYVGIPSS